MLLKDIATVNMTADGQVIGAEEFKPLRFWLQDALCSLLSNRMPECSIVNKSRLLYDLN